MWQPIETAPERTLVLTSAGRGFKLVLGERIGGVWLDDLGEELGKVGYAPSHWMPLPEPPKEAGAECS